MPRSTLRAVVPVAGSTVAISNRAPGSDWPTPFSESRCRLCVGLFPLRWKPADCTSATARCAKPAARRVVGSFAALSRDCWPSQWHRLRYSYARRAATATVQPSVFLRFPAEQIHAVRQRAGLASTGGAQVNGMRELAWGGLATCGSPVRLLENSSAMTVVLKCCATNSLAAAPIV
jgi:hypothetical protein